VEVHAPHHDERAGRAAADEARALARLTAAIRTAPDDPSVHYARASKLLALGLPAEASRDAATCLELDPRHAKAHLARGRALHSLGEFRVSFRHYEAGLELAPRASLSAWLAREMPRPEYRVAEASAAALRRRVQAAVSANDTQALTLLLKRCERSSLLPKFDGGLGKASEQLASSSSAEEAARSALHLAAVEGHTDCVVLLLRHGVPATSRDEHGRTPLMAALIASNVDAALALMPPPLAALPPAFLHAGATTPAKRAEGVHAACSLGRTALHLAAARGLLSCTLRLLDAGADVRACDEHGRTPLHFASAAGQGLILGQLVARESGRAGIDDQDADGRTPALLAARTAYSASRTRSPCASQIAQLVQCVSLCVHYGAHVDTAPLDDGRTLIHYAAALGAQDTLALLLSRSADVKAACTTDGTMALHFAAAHGQPSSARMLLAAGAQADAPDASGLLPLEHALRGSDECTPHEGHAACHELLLRHLAR
jgi:ankyrin repeat protein